MRPEQTRGARTAALGQWGEELAAEHLVASGMQVLARNWRCPQGELDLVARDVDGTVVFVEVPKTRRRRSPDRRSSDAVACRQGRCCCGEGERPAGP